MTHLFGTNGIRWIIDQRTVDFPVKLGLVAGTLFGPGARIGLGMDTRTSGPMIFNAILTGLNATGCNVVDLGVLPTPALQWAVRDLKLDGGIVVTASHNPPEFNGLKFIASDGTEFSKEQQDRFEDYYFQNKIKRSPWDNVGKVNCEKHVQERYRDAIISMVELGPQKPRAMVDCGNGTSWDYTPRMLTKLGCSVMTLNAQPDGRFPGRLPEPTKANLLSLMAAVREHDLDIGIAHDGDADRATFVDENGRFITGDQSLAIFAADAVANSKGGKVVVPINTSMTVLDVITQNGGEPVITPVGSPLIARKMMETNAILGGEGNGGVLFPGHQYCRDGMMTALKMVEIISHKGPVSELVADLPAYCLMRDKLTIPPEKKEAIMERVKQEASGQVLDIDGIKIVEDDYWILVRPSGTEPILRVTVETKSKIFCKTKLQESVAWVKEIITGLV